MLEITPRNAQQWSRFGSRAVFGLAILSLAETKKNLMVLSADLGGSSGLSRFKNKYPDSYVNIGISEQNMIGVAAGLAKEGFVVFATSFAPFIAMRASEQIRMNMGYMNLNVKAVAIGSGVSMAFLGNSHYGIEDASVMRSIPNLTVVSPADCGEIIKAVFAAAELLHENFLTFGFSDDFRRNLGTFDVRFAKFESTVGGDGQYTIKCNLFSGVEVAEINFQHLAFFDFVLVSTVGNNRVHGFVSSA